MENLQQDFADLCRVLRLPMVRLPRRNRRLHRHYSWYYDDATRELVGAYYSRDIAAFGYRFERSPGADAWNGVQAAAAAILNGLRIPVTMTGLRCR
jgi:hypothetical protein